MGHGRITFNVMVQPPLKWAGGKRQILDEIRGCFPPQDVCEAFHEPFFGGGALFFKTGPHAKRSSINDINKRLMNFYRVVEDNPDALINTLEEFEPPESPPDPDREFAEQENYYYQQRALFNRRPNGKSFDEVEEAALLMYLNRTCFNGLYRENSDGEFNVPIGRHSSQNWIQSSRIKEASRALEGVNIKDGDFSYVREYAEPGDLVYFDPPYRPVSATSSFVEYSSDAFGPDEQKRLRDLVVELHKADVHVVVSNSPPIRELYNNLDGIFVKDIGAKRSINSNGDDRGEVGEIIITNVPPEKRRVKDPDLEEFAQS